MNRGLNINLNNAREKTPLILLLICIILVANLLSNKITQLDIRMLMVIIVSAILFIFSLNYRIGIYFLLSYLIIMPFLRRLTYLFQERVVNDPLLVIPDIILILMMFGYWMFESNHIVKYISQDRLTKILVIFIGLCILMIFNPLQGGILIGLAGAKFFILPIAWFFLGLILTKDNYKTLLAYCLITGALAGVYSIYQFLFGYFDFEMKWIKEIELLLYLREKVRPFSVFAGNSDAARYFQLSAGIGFLYVLSGINPIRNFTLFVICFIGLILTVSRSGVFAFLFCVGIFLIWRGENVKRIIINSIFLLMVVLILYNVIPEEYKKEDSNVTERTFATHLRAGLLNPTQEGSVKVRFEAWKGIPKLLLKSPFGYGIGSITLAAQRYKGFLFYTESSYFGIWGATGIPGGLLFTYLLYLSYKYLIEIYLLSEDKRFWRIIFGFYSGMVGSILIAELFNFYAVVPYFWLTLGWIVRTHWDLKYAFNSNSKL